MIPRLAGERPRSSTVDPVDRIWRRGETPGKRRSRSAIPVLLAHFESPPAAVSSPRQLALVPQGRAQSRDSLDDRTLLATPSTANIPFSVEVTKRSGSGYTLPPIHSSTETQSTATAAAAAAAAHSNNNTPAADHKVCIVSLGEEMIEKPTSRGGGGGGGGGGGRHHSKRVTSGKLSLGYSLPKPVGPISGTSIHTVTSPRGKRTQLSVQENSNLSSLQENPKNCVLKEHPNMGTDQEHPNMGTDQEHPNMDTDQEHPNMSTGQEAGASQPVHIIMDKTLLEEQTV